MSNSNTYYKNTQNTEEVKAEITTHSALEPTMEAPLRKSCSCIHFHMLSLSLPKQKSVPITATTQRRLLRCGSRCNNW